MNEAKKICIKKVNDMKGSWVLNIRVNLISFQASEKEALYLCSVLGKVLDFELIEKHRIKSFVKEEKVKLIGQANVNLEKGLIPTKEHS